MLRAVTGVGLVATAAVTLLACAKPTFDSTWKNPAAQSFGLEGKRGLLADPASVAAVGF